MLEVVLSVYADGVMVLTFMLPQFNAPCREWPHWISWSVRPVLYNLCSFIVLAALTTQNCVWWSWSWCTTWCLYECETWSVSREDHRLAVFNNRVLRKIRIFGRKREEVIGGWRRALWFVICTVHIIRMIMSRRRRWVGHVARVWEERNAYRRFSETRRKETIWRK
jgi:hypothetical protein